MNAITIAPHISCPSAPVTEQEFMRLPDDFPDAQRIRVFTLPTVFTDYAADAEIDTGAILPHFRARAADLFALPHRRPV